MTTLSPTSRRAAAPASTVRWSFSGVLSSEFTKLLTLRSTFVIAAVMVLISVGFSALVASTYGDVDNGAAGIAADLATASSIGSSVSFAQLVIGVLAVLIVSNEYGTNMIQSSIVATPKRLPILAAKLIVAAVATVGLSIVSSIVSYVAAAPILGGDDLAAPLTDGRVLGAVFGSVLYLLAVALFSASAAMIVKNSAAGIAIMAGVFFVLPLVLNLLPSSGIHYQEYVLGYSAQNLSGALWQDGLKRVGLSIGVTAVWIVAPAIAAFTLLKKRDA